VARPGARALTASFQAGDQLAEAAAECVQAQFAYTGTFPPRSLADEDEAAFADGIAGAEVVLVSVLHRADYCVTDTDAVLQAGRRACMEMWPDGADDAASEVDHRAARSIRSSTPWAWRRWQRPRAWSFCTASARSPADITRSRRRTVKPCPKDTGHAGARRPPRAAATGAGPVQVALV
jgi:hypothetical protein